MEQKNLFIAIDAALRAGAEILSIYNDPASDFEVERKADNSPLTIADRKAHEVIRSYAESNSDSRIKRGRETSGLCRA